MLEFEIKQSGWVGFSKKYIQQRHRGKRVAK